MKTKLALAITSALALTACVDDYELTSEGENFHSVGIVEITGDTTTGETLTATITDNDGFSVDAVTYTWYLDNAPISNTASTYLLTDADVDKVLSVKVEYVDDAGYSEVSISEFTDVVEIPSVPSAGSVAIEGDAFVGFILTAEITDDNGVGDNDVTYTWKAGGVVIEDSNDAKIQLTDAHLDLAITVSVSYIDNDGYEETDVESAATDIVAPSVESSKVATISDSTDEDAGELRVKFADSAVGIDPILAGKLSVRFAKDDVISTADGVDTAKEAYIALWGSSTSTYDALVDLRIGNGNYTVRNHSGSDSIALTQTFTAGDWIDVDMVWDASLATPTVTIFLDDVEVYSAETTSDGLSYLTEGVQYVVFKLSDTGSTPTGSFRVDDLAIYNDIAGSSLVFEDDFESYITGASLDTGQKYVFTDVIDETSPYNNNSEDVIVEEVLIDAGGDTPVVVGGQALTLTDKTSATSGSAKFALPVASAKGKLTMSFYKEPSQGYDSGTIENEKDAYIGLYTSSGSNKNAIIDLRLHGAYPDDGGTPADGKTEVDYGTLEQRNGSGLELDPAVILTATDSSIVDLGAEYNQGVHYTINEWHELVMEWDATSETEVATVTVTLDGVAQPAFSSASVQPVNADEVANLTLKYGDTSRDIPNGEFHVDDIKVYSIDSEGTETLDLDYNFDSDTLGEAPTGASSAVEATISERTL